MKHISEAIPKKDQIINFIDSNDERHDFVAYCETINVKKWEAVVVDYTNEELLEKFKNEFGDKNIHFELFLDTREQPIICNKMIYKYLDSENLEYLTDYMTNLINGDARIFKLSVKIYSTTVEYMNTVSMLESFVVGKSIALSQIIDGMIFDIVKHKYKDIKKEIYA